MLPRVVLGFWSNSQWINWQLPPPPFSPTASWHWIKEREKQVWTLDSPITASNMANIFCLFLVFFYYFCFFLVLPSLWNINPWNSRWHHSTAGFCIFNILSIEVNNFKESSTLVHPRQSWNPECHGLHSAWYQGLQDIIKIYDPVSQ